MTDADPNLLTFSTQLPSNSNDFQNFALWPMFTVMNAEQIVAVVEATLSPQGRIIFTSQHPAILTSVAEAVRFYVKTWAGLYVPVVYSRHAQQHIDEPAPYILGVTKQSRALFTAPRDALLVDLDFQRIFTTRPPGSLSPRQRKKYAVMLSKALGSVQTTGVPQHLRSAYDPNSQFSAVGALITSDPDARAIRDPSWWDPVSVRTAMDHISKRVRQNYKLLAALNSVKQQSTKVSWRDLSDITHDRNFLSRSVEDAWQSYIKFKRRSDAKVLDLLKRETTLQTDLQNQKREYADLSECTEQLIEETRQLQGRVNQQMRDNVVTTSQLRDKALHAKQLSNHVSELQSELAEATRTLSAQQELLDEIERSRNNARTSTSDMEDRCDMLTQERDEAHRAVIHLTSLISSQMTYIERVMSSLVAQLNRPSSRAESRNSKRRSFQSLTVNSPVTSSPVQSQFPLLKPEHEAALESRRYTTDFSPSVLNPLTAAIAAHAASTRCESPLFRSESVDDEPSIKEKVGAVASTVRKINDQCRTAIQDLAEKRTAINARLDPSTTPQNLARRLSTGSLRSSSAPAAVVPNAISRLIESSRREIKEGDMMSLASSQISKVTVATSILSSVPSLSSMAPTALSETSERIESSPDRTLELKNAVRIQPIPEDLETDGHCWSLPTKAEQLTITGVLGRNIFS